MFVQQNIYSILTRAIAVVLFMGIVIPVAYGQTKTDSTKALKNITVKTNTKLSAFAQPVPVQLLDHTTLQQINAESVADAAKYFSGVLIKDFGGVGGLKTISVRGLGAFNTGLLYDGIPVADAQTGQIDLSKFSSTFVQTLELDEANPQQILLPARAYSSASVLAITTNSFNTTNFTQEKWRLGIKQGSFGLWQPYAGLYLPTGKNMVISANAEALWSKGNYPYYINNGSYSQNATRINSDIQSFQEEFNIVKLFADSSTLQTKLWGYGAQRGLPGSIIFFNNISAQRLQDEDYFAQSRYQKKLSATTSLLISAKYSHLYTRYTDPNFPNNVGGLDDRYTQQEVYISTALSHRFGKYLLGSFASDFATTSLTANINDFANPTRNTWWNSIAVQYARQLWQVNASLLNTVVNDKTVTGPVATNKNEYTPTVAASYKTTVTSPFLFRAFYKNIFRLPTFDDIYYTYISNINPKLSPEYSIQYDAGITYSTHFNSWVKQFDLGIDGYYNTVKNKIIAIPGQNLFIWTMTNLGKVHITGMDLTGAFNGNFSSVTRWSARMAYTLQRALNVTDPMSSEYNNEIPYTPYNSGSALVAVYYKDWNAGYGFLFSGARYTLGTNDPSNELNGWNTHDVFISRGVHFKQVQAMLKGEINNLFNERYDVINYYPMPGRSYKITLTFNNI